MIQEDTVANGKRITVKEAAIAGRHIRPAGELELFALLPEGFAQDQHTLVVELTVLVALTRYPSLFCARPDSADAERGPFDHHRRTRFARLATFGRSFGGYVRDRFHSPLTADHVSHQGVHGR